MEEKVKELIEKPLEDINVKVCNITYTKESNTYFLRVIIDKEPYVDVDTCVEVTNVINPLLDTIEEKFDDSYILDVCSYEKGDN